MTSLKHDVLTYSSIRGMEITDISKFFLCWYRRWYPALAFSRWLKWTSDGLIFHIPHSSTDEAQACSDYRALFWTMFQSLWFVTVPKFWGSVSVLSPKYQLTIFLSSDLYLHLQIKKHISLISIYSFAVSSHLAYPLVILNLISAVWILAVFLSFITQVLLVYKMWKLPSLYNFVLSFPLFSVASMMVCLWFRILLVWIYMSPVASLELSV